MSVTSPRPVLTVYRRAACELCDELAVELQAALEDRARAGAVVPAVTEVDVTTDPELEARYGGLVPVFALGGLELPLVMSGRQARAFLDRTLPRTA
jgi:hypothetical protein